MRADRGSVTLWMLGLSVVLLLFGGLAVDLWRALAVQRAVATMADSAAIAGASGIDEGHYRNTGEVMLEPSRVTDLAAASIASQGPAPSEAEVRVSSDFLSVTVIVSDEVELGLLGLFVDQSEPLLVRASATATPRLVP